MVCLSGRRKDTKKHMDQNQQRIYEAALIGLEQQRARIDVLVVDVKNRLNQPTATAATAATTPAAEPNDNDNNKRVMRVMSAAARKRISAAQKKRWSNYHLALVPDPLEPKQRRKTPLSRKQIAAMRANAVKARAAKKKRSA